VARTAGIAADLFCAADRHRDAHSMVVHLGGATRTTEARASLPDGQIGSEAKLLDLLPGGTRRRLMRVKIACAEKPISGAASIPSPLSSPSRENKSLSFFQKSRIPCAVPLPHEGRFAVVTDVGGGMRWPVRVAARHLAGRRTTRIGRRNRMVLILRR
jgi:hypothetical protein